MGVERDLRGRSDFVHTLLASKHLISPPAYQFADLCQRDGPLSIPEPHWPDECCNEARSSVSNDEGEAELHTLT